MLDFALLTLSVPAHPNVALDVRNAVVAHLVVQRVCDMGGREQLAVSEFDFQY